MTGRIHYTPEAEQQFNHLDEWITEKASVDTARRFISATMTHCERILEFPLAGRARDDIRPGMRTSTYKKRTLVAYEVDESSGGLAVNILGVFHGGQDWETALREGQGDPEAGR